MASAADEYNTLYSESNGLYSRDTSGLYTPSDSAYTTENTGLFSGTEYWTMQTPK